MGLLCRAVCSVRSILQITSRRRITQSAQRKKYSGVEKDYDRLQYGVVGATVPTWNSSPMLTTIAYVFYVWSGFTFSCSLMVDNIKRKR